MKAERAGILAAIMGSLCCIGPLLLVFLGLSSLGIGAIFSRYHWVFIGVALLFLIRAYYLYFHERRRCCEAQCEMRSKRLREITLIISTLAVLFFAGANLYVYSFQKSDSQTKRVKIASTSSQSQGMTANLSVEGLTCFACEIGVKKALTSMPGVRKVEASAKDKRVMVQYDPNQMNNNKIISAIEKMGYRVFGGDFR